MKNKIEVQIHSAATREQLIQLRDEIRKIDGLEAFDLQLPPAPLTPGKMDGGLTFLILEAVIAGVTHFTAERTAEYYEEKIADVSKKILSSNRNEPKAEVEAMSGSNPAEGEKWKVTIADNRNGARSITSYDDTGSVNLFTNREYSIDPEHTYAVLIGTSEYEDRANFSPIPPVAGNLDEMYRILSDKTLVGLPYQNITRLYNESCINIKDELRNVSRTSDIKTLIIYYSGHGQNMGNNQLSLIAKDTRNIDDELHNDIPYAFVEKMVNSSGADQKIIFIDACHSGLAAQGNTNVFDFEPVLGTFTLASTSADDSSYFKRDAANTYFTTYLAEAFKEGIANSNRMLSLNDLYNYTSQKLAKVRLPAPVCKTQLKNITADKFYISGNPSFSMEARLGTPKLLYQQGRYEEARREYILLEKEYPDNIHIRNEHIEFERNTEFNRLVREGDLLFFKDKNFRAAQVKYREALSVKYDENIRDKIADCENSLQTQSQPGQKTVVSDNKEIIKPKPLNTVLKKEIPDPLRKKKLQTIRIGIISIAVLGLIYYLFSHKERNFVDYDNTPYKYKGGLQNDKPDGEGKAHFQDGREYEGEWRNGLREGKGTFTWANGDTYTGYFKNNELNGIGICKYINGAVYEGSWVFGNWQGRGKFKDKDGNIYEGNYNNNYRNGSGTFTWTNGDTYSGNFYNDYRYGKGVYTSILNVITNCPNCRKYDGYWKNDLKEGHGKCFDASGVLIYEGEFANNKPVNPVYPYR